MELVTTPRVAFLRDLADQILAHYGRGRTIVAIEGPLQSGKTGFADDLAAVFAEREHPVFRASMEAFHRSRAEQAQFGADTPARYLGYGFDESALRRVLLEPFRFGGSAAFVTAVMDPRRDAWVQPRWITGPADATLLLDGRFLGRSRLAGLWDFRIVLDGDAVDPADELYVQTEGDPRLTASAVVDNRDPEHPRRRFFDSC